MKKLSLLILSLTLCVPPLPVFAFQTETYSDTKAVENPYQVVEAGLANANTVPKPFFLLAQGHYAEALTALSSDLDAQFPTLRPYLSGLVTVSKPLVSRESDHFVLYLPPDQIFLADYALPSLEKSADFIAKSFGHRPKEKVRVEIYPTKEDFSAASTLSIETLERSGAIGICKFHRLMIMSPQTLPLGYRWMDALSHEYLHLTINEITASKAELWLHEGTARFFETGYRLNPPAFLTPQQKTQLKEAVEGDKLIPFARMSPSLVYLKDQEEVGLAFCQVSYAVSRLVNDEGMPRFVAFLNALRTQPFRQAFQSNYKKTTEQFEAFLAEKLKTEPWEKTKGAMSDEVRFGNVSELDLVGADVEGKIRLGDRMRVRGHAEGALVEYEEALKEEPDNAIALLKAAKTNLILGNKEKAVEELRRATEKNPNYGTPHVELARLVEGGEALPHLLEANAINPFNPEIHHLLSEAYHTLGRDPESRREEEIFKSLQP